MLDTTLRELYWHIRTKIQRWRYRWWPSKDSGTGELRVVNLEEQMDALAFDLRDIKAWKAPERVPPFLEMAAPRGTESEEKS